MAHHEELLAVEQAAVRLAIKPKTLRNWIGERRISVYRVGRCVRVAASEIERVLEEGFVPAHRDVA
ncbi:helix-turn-helix domain-containing protein [Silvibacterium dinghuense]|uniref:DNA-binding protein n=1 Tax=Silvibacterium dinghuense TaxID=1560006 RepID=A0A4Q1S9E5_9BACT|nr:helix-turn-helix domain-containing protein [Silvibacterium dinghuense]RXS93686.1 DNA-binding protein [Silvibacterium dinghuense]